MKPRTRAPSELHVNDRRCGGGGGGVGGPEILGALINWPRHRRTATTSNTRSAARRACVVSIMLNAQRGDVKLIGMDGESIETLCRNLHYYNEDLTSYDALDLCHPFTGTRRARVCK